MNTELFSIVAFAIALTGLVLGVVNLVLVLLLARIVRRDQSALGQWKQGVERQLGILDGTVTRLTAEADRRRGSSDGREE